MGSLELSAGLAMLASLFAALQAVTVEYGLSNGDYAERRSPALAAAVISIVVGATLIQGLTASWTSAGFTARTRRPS